MFSSKMYLKILFFILGIIVTITVSYSYHFAKNYPLPITNRISLDAKLQFIREHIDTHKIDTIVVGSSLALNNVQGIYLEKGSINCQNVLNLSVWAIGPVQVEQLLKLSDAFPNLKRIIYSGQFSDFGGVAQFKDFDDLFIKDYISNELNPFEYLSLLLNSCKDLSFCMKRKEEWKNKHVSNKKFAYLKFDHTGSAPLHVYGKNIIQHRWKNPHGAGQHPLGFEAVGRMAKKAKKDGLKFYFVQQPYRQPLIDKHPHVKKNMKDFPKRIKNSITKDGGMFLNLHETLHLSDEYFSDRSHLNDKGSLRGTEIIAKFIDESEKNKNIE